MTSERIALRRQTLGLTLQEVGDYIGVSKATVQRYESGEIKNLKLETIEKLADILKTTPGYLMGWENPSNDNQSVYMKLMKEAEENGVDPKDIELVIELAKQRKRG